MSTTQSKRAILEEVRAVLHSEPRLGAGFRPERLEIDEEGTLTLAGEVASVAAKKLALERVAAVEGVAAIADHLHVTPATPMGDAEIRAHLREFFSEEPAFQGLAVRQLHHENFEPGYQPVYEVVAGDPSTARGHIDIEVRDGVVTLSGQIPGLNSKRLAGVMAWWVPGVRDVVNGLAVEPPEQDGPIRIEEAVRIVLERDPYVDAGQIRVEVRGREIRLTGLLPTEELRNMAEQDAWCVLGVDNVINQIAVRR